MRPVPISAAPIPAVRIGMRAGTCAGLVATEADGLIFPRSILQIPGDDKFVVADMVGWGSLSGKLLLLDPAQPPGHRITELIGGLDQPFGLQRGPDNKIYASTAETIFRFDPLAENPKATIAIIVRGLPGNRVTLSDGTVIDEAAHPLKAFVFDKTGKLYVNVGAPTDNCLPSNTSKPCAAGEGASPFAAIWVFTPPAGGIFPALKSGDANPKREIFARGLRNSMALAMYPDFPDAGVAFLQAENGRDLPDIFQPNEEINALEKGKHYGWPYCYDLKTVSPEFKSFLRTVSPYKNLCGNAALYRAPLSLLPPHSAPLGMLYYRGDKFPELKGKLIVGLHGYRPTGGRILVYDVDDKGFPTISPPPVHYNVSCAAEPVRAFQTEGTHQVAAAAYTELVSGWYRVNGVRPQGAPVGMTVASDGAIWVVEDRNKTVLRIDTTTAPAPPPLPCGNRTAQQIAELSGFVAASSRQSRTAHPNSCATGRETLHGLPFGFRREAGSKQHGEGRSSAQFPAVAGRMALSRRPQCVAIAHPPARHRQREADAARRRRPHHHRAGLQAIAGDSRSVDRHHGSGNADADQIWPRRAAIPEQGRSGMRRHPGQRPCRRDRAVAARKAGLQPHLPASRHLSQW